MVLRLASKKERTVLGFRQQICSLQKQSIRPLKTRNFQKKEKIIKIEII